MGLCGRPIPDAGCRYGGYGDDYSKEIYTLDLKLAGLLPRMGARPGIARFLLLSGTYETKGYRYSPRRPERKIGIEVGLNVREVLVAVGVPEAKTWGKVRSRSRSTSGSRTRAGLALRPEQRHVDGAELRRRLRPRLHHLRLTLSRRGVPRATPRSGPATRRSRRGPRERPRGARRRSRSRGRSGAPRHGRRGEREEAPGGSRDSREHGRQVETFRAAVELDRDSPRGGGGEDARPVGAHAAPACRRAAPWGARGRRRRVSRSRGRGAPSGRGGFAGPCGPTRRRRRARDGPGRHVERPSSAMFASAPRNIVIPRARVQESTSRRCARKSAGKRPPATAQSRAWSVRSA